jgi:hypothetical protein
MLLANNPAFAGRKQVEQNLLRLVCGCVAGLAFGLCKAIWCQVALLNVWALSTLLFAAVLALLMQWGASPRQRRFLHAAVFVFGLLLTNSQSLMWVAPGILLWVMVNDPKLGRDLVVFAAIFSGCVSTIITIPDISGLAHRDLPWLIAFAPGLGWALVTLIKTRRVGSEWKATLVCGALFMAGLGFYFYSALASMTTPPLNWGYPRTVEGFYQLVSRGQYDKFNPTGDLGVFLGQLGIEGQEIGGALGWLYFIFMPMPFLMLRRSPRGAVRWMLGLTAAFICAGPVTVAMLNPIRDRGVLFVAEPKFSVVYVILSIWAGLGLMLFGATVARIRAHSVTAPSAGVVPKC